MRIQDCVTGFRHLLQFVKPFSSSIGMTLNKSGDQGADPHFDCGLRWSVAEERCQKSLLD